MLSMTLWTSFAGICLSNRLLDQIAKVGRFFNAHSGRSPQMKFESAAVYTGEEIAAQPGNQNCQGAETERKERDQEGAPVMESRFPAGCDSFCESFRRPLQNVSESAPADCGWRHVQPPFFLLATNTWPSSGRWSGRENKMPAWRRRRLRRAVQRGNAPRPIAETSEQTQYRLQAWTRRQVSRFATRCQGQLRPCLCLVLPHDSD